MGIYGLLCFWPLTSQVDPRSRSTNSVQGVQLRVVPGLRRYSTFTRGSIRLLMTLIDLTIISDGTVASMMWNFYRFRVGGTCPLAGQPRIFWGWCDCKIIKLKELSSLLFYVYAYFACIYVCAPGVCLMPVEGREN